MSTVEFRAYALPTAVSRKADHTYVIDFQGGQYPCWGRSSGGKEICTGYGDLRYAKCLATPDLKAGIKYARTGVCHQTANRILYPSGILVSSAKGYRLSTFVWTTYGLFKWNELHRCKGTVSVPPDDLSPYDAAIRSLYSKLDFLDLPEDIHNKELLVMVQVFLGAKAIKNYFSELASLQNQLHESIVSLRESLAAQKIEPMEYLIFLKSLQNQIFDECWELLGSENFAQLFDADVNAVNELIDEEEFLSSL